MNWRAWCACLLLFLAAGCSRRIVGGPCEYETALGTAQLIRQPDELAGQFTPAGPVADAKLFALPSERIFQVHSDMDDLRTDRPYPAELTFITEGTCTPFYLVLISFDSVCRGIFLPMSENGRLTGEGERMLAQVAEIFERLLPAWPELIVKLGCQYSKNEMSTEGVAGRLVAAGVSADRIRVSEPSDIYSYGLDTEEETGVLVCFCLTGCDGAS